MPLQNCAKPITEHLYKCRGALLITFKVSDIFGVLCMHLVKGPLSRCRARDGSREGPGDDDPPNCNVSYDKQ